MSDHQTAAILLTDFQKLCINFATGTNVDYADYEEARHRVVSDIVLHPRLPDWVFEKRFGSQFWTLMKETSDNYAGRRAFLYDSLGAVFDYIEKKGVEPSSLSIEEALKTCNSRTIEDLWLKIHSRRESDPEGAITAARSLVESTCKFILDSLAVHYPPNADLPALYGATAKALTLGPGQHKEEVFKQILSGCHSVIHGLAAIRNAFGDAHGKNDQTPKPSKRHSDLAVNSAGTIATFLISTYEHRVKMAKK
ncbi:MAG: abortive infection family protein [Proteobacteria bacterium]|jgi:hypothetical protein|nr:abortive infection family protein [Pseudomonadota bacterium]